MKAGKKCVNCLPGKLGKCANNLNTVGSHLSKHIGTKGCSDK